MSNSTEPLLSGGESATSASAYTLYRLDVARGKSLLQLKAVAEDVTPLIRMRWSERSFTPVATDIGTFDALVCNIAYHFHKHGQKYGSIQRMTDEATRAFLLHRREATVCARDGLLNIANVGLYELDGRIVTFFGSPSK